MPIPYGIPYDKDNQDNLKGLKLKFTSPFLLNLLCSYRILPLAALVTHRNLCTLIPFGFAQGRL